MLFKKKFKSSYTILTLLVLLCSLINYSKVYSQSLDNKDLHLSNIEIKGDFWVGNQYTNVILNNAKIEGNLNISNKTTNLINVSIDSESYIGTIIADRPIVIENNGHINNIKSEKSATVSGVGEIKYLVLRENSNIENKINICFDFSGDTVFSIQPDSFYKNGEKIASNPNNIKPGILNLLNTEYYFDDSLNMLTGIVSINDKKYIYTSNGKQIGMTKFNDNYYLCDSDGSIKTSWQEYKGNTYFFNADGKMQVGYLDIQNKKYYFKENGQLLKNAWIQDYKAQYNGELFYTRTGNKETDADIDEMLSKIIKKDMTEREKMLAIYKWMPLNFKWRNVPVDIRKGYSDAKILELAQYGIDNMRGSCEHYASLECLFMRRMGYPTQVIEGIGLHTYTEHSWIRINIDGLYFNFDPQYEANNMKNDVLSNFLKTDKEFKKHHKF